MVTTESVLEVWDGHLSVELGAVDGAVPEKLLDVTDGSTASQKMSGAELLLSSGRPVEGFILSLLVSLVVKYKTYRRPG